MHMGIFLQLKRLGDCVAASVLQGMFVEFLAGGGGRHSDFETRWTKAIEPPGPRQERHENQTTDERVGAQVARGGLYGRSFGPPLFTMLSPTPGRSILD
jgi:hypothetical protein